MLIGEDKIEYDNNEGDINTDNSQILNYVPETWRLVIAQKTSHKQSVIFCNRCFMSFDDRSLKHKSSGQAALNEHKIICGSRKAVFPILPVVGECTEFKSWGNTNRHQFVIYAEFEALLVKTDEAKGRKTTIIKKSCSFEFFIYSEGIRRRTHRVI